MAFFNKAEKGAVQRAKTGSATTANKAEKGAVQGGYSVSGLLTISKTENITVVTTPVVVTSDPQIIASDAVSVADTGAAYFLFEVAEQDAVSVTDTPAVAPAVSDLSIGIVWEDLTLWVQGVKVSG